MLQAQSMDLNRGPAEKRRNYLNQMSASLKSQFFNESKLKQSPSNKYHFNDSRIKQRSPKRSPTTKPTRYQPDRTPQISRVRPSRRLMSRQKPDKSDDIIMDVTSNDQHGNRINLSKLAQRNLTNSNSVEKMRAMTPGKDRSLTAGTSII